MKNRKPYRTLKERVKSKQGRLDVLAVGLIDEFAKQNPLLSALVEELRPEIEIEIAKATRRYNRYSKRAVSFSNRLVQGGPKC